MSDLLLIRPATNVAGAELASWGATLGAEIRKSTHLLRADLFSSAATRPAVERELSTSRCTIFFGHGFRARLEGHGGDVGDALNVGKAANNLIVAIACWSAHTLGSQALTAGVEAYLGFDERLVWLTNDPDAQFAPATLSGLRLLNAGSDMVACENEMKTWYASVFAYYSTGLGTGKPNSVLGWLAASWNESHVVLYGSAHATF